MCSDAHRRLELSAGELQVLLLDERLGQLALQGVDSLLIGCDDRVRGRRRCQGRRRRRDAQGPEDGRLRRSVRAAARRRSTTSSLGRARRRRSPRATTGGAVGSGPAVVEAARSAAGHQAAPPARRSAARSLRTGRTRDCGPPRPAEGSRAPRVSTRTVGTAPQTQGRPAGQTQPPVAALGEGRFTSRSSPEWYEMHDTTAPRDQQVERGSRAPAASTSSSSLTAMRSAWNTRLAGWPGRLRATPGS